MHRLLVVLVGLAFLLSNGALAKISSSKTISSGATKSKAVSSGASKSKAALPQAKKGKSKGGDSRGRGRESRGFPRTVGGGLMYRVFREMKTAFGSEMEALTLTLTRPTDAAIPESSLDDLMQCYEGEFENPQFTVSLMTKLSRKLGEANVYTKLKALLCLHRLMENSSEQSQTVLLQCVRSLRSEVDDKVGQPFFAAESVESVADTASSVGEAEASEIAKEYVSYVFDFLDCKGETPRKVSKDHASVDRLEILLSLVEHGFEVEDKCKASSGSGSGRSGLLKQVSECCKRNRAWLLKQAARLYELRAYGADTSIKKEVEAVLTEFNVKFVKVNGMDSDSDKDKDQDQHKGKEDDGATSVTTKGLNTFDNNDSASASPAAAASGSAAASASASASASANTTSQSPRTAEQVSAPLRKRDEEEEGDDEDEEEGHDEDHDEDDDKSEGKGNGIGSSSSSSSSSSKGLTKFRGQTIEDKEETRKDNTRRKKTKREGDGEEGSDDDGSDLDDDDDSKDSRKKKQSKQTKALKSKSPNIVVSKEVRE